MRFLCLVLILLTNSMMIFAQTATTENVTSVLGTTSKTIIAVLDNTPETTCPIQRGITILAVAQMDENQLLAYTNSFLCEGLVRLVNDGIVWENDQQVNQLIHLSRDMPPVLNPEPNTPLLTGLDTDELCQNPSDWITFPTQRPIKVYIHQWMHPEEGLEWIPNPSIPYREDEIDVVLCMKTMRVRYGIKNYSDEGTLTPVSRNRIDIMATLVTYPSGDIVGRRILMGAEPPPFPRQTTLLSIDGKSANTIEAIVWMVEQISDGAENARTVVNTYGLNVRSEPNPYSTVLGELDYGEPVNLIGRGIDVRWVVALLPDMSLGWVFTELLTIASTTDIYHLPVLEGVPLADMPLIPTP